MLIASGVLGWLLGLPEADKINGLRVGLAAHWANELPLLLITAEAAESSRGQPD